MGPEKLFTATHGNGQSIGLQQNLAAWVLASAWRGMTLYPLHGPAVITGRTRDGGLAALDDYLAQTVRETLIAWQARHPATNETAIAELLAYAFRDVTTDPVVRTVHRIVRSGLLKFIAGADGRVW
ncbi:hypothetical protein ACFXKC_42755 [Streptomyces sp. NPDC059340]|uniref:hypothetical protein n=1 Tax=Streptomyces sp. NPDC059340 TaxID=3346806 RepID=UPI00369024FC